MIVQRLACMDEISYHPLVIGKETVPKMADRSQRRIRKDCTAEILPNRTRHHDRSIIDLIDVLCATSLALYINNFIVTNKLREKQWVTSVEPDLWTSLHLWLTPPPRFCDNLSTDLVLQSEWTKSWWSTGVMIAGE